MPPCHEKDNGGRWGELSFHRVLHWLITWPQPGLTRGDRVDRRNFRSPLRSGPRAADYHAGSPGGLGPGETGAMDIRGPQSRNINPGDEPRGPRCAGQTPAARNASERSEGRVTFFTRPHAFQETRRALSGVPGVRTELVEAVRNKLADGTLAVDHQRIARALLDQGIVSF